MYAAELIMTNNAKYYIIVKGLTNRKGYRPCKFRSIRQSTKH